MLYEIKMDSNKIFITILERSPFSNTQFNFCSFKEQIGIHDASLTIAASITNKLRGASPVNGVFRSLISSVD